MLTLLVFGTLAMTVRRLAWMVRLLTLATLVICAAGLAHRAGHRARAAANERVIGRHGDELEALEVEGDAAAQQAH